jgi:hypothetical protein
VLHKCPGIGIATGEVNPKASDWTRTNRTYGASQYIGLAPGANGRIELLFPPSDINNQVVFVTATAGVAIDAVIDATSGAVNKTGAALVSGDWAWGMVPV